MRRAERVAAGFAVAVFSIFSAGFHCGGPVQVTLGEPFELRPGEKAAVAGGELVVTFLSVLEDSRCPKGEQCIVAGKARLSLEAAERQGDPVRFELNTAEEPSEAEIPGFRVTLVGLQPYPISGRPISPGDYIAKLTIHRQ